MAVETVPSTERRKVVLQPPEERAFELRFEIGFLAKRTHGFFQGLEA